MKKYILHYLFVCFVSVLIASPDVAAQCDPDAGVVANPVPEGTNICNDGSNKDLLAVDFSTIGYTGVTDYIIAVSGPLVGDTIRPLLGGTYDGVYDFSMDEDGNPFAPGEYCFTGFGYNQEELDEITNNGTIQNFINFNNFVPDCISGGESIDELLNCIQTSPTLVGADSLLALEDVAFVIDSILPGLGIEACIIFAEPYCINVADAADCDGEVGLTTMIDEQSIRSYPNPVKEWATIEFNSSEYALINIEVYDMVGRIVHAEEMQSVVGSNTVQIDASDLLPGVYFYRLESNGLSYTKRMVVDR